MLGVHYGMILQANVSESADMSRAYRVAIYTANLLHDFSGLTNGHDKSQCVNRP